MFYAQTNSVRKRRNLLHGYSRRRNLLDGYSFFGIHIQKKIVALQDFSVPTDVKKLRSFLGLTSYYLQFMNNYAKLAKPLHDLTKRDAPLAGVKRLNQLFKN